MSDLVLGPSSTEELENDMRNYQLQKQAKRAAEQADDTEAALVATANMAYWNAQMIADGAISLEVCAAPSQWLWDSWNDSLKQDYLDQQAQAERLVWVMEKQGLPIPN